MDLEKSIKEKRYRNYLRRSVHTFCGGRGGMITTFSRVRGDPLSSGNYLLRVAERERIQQLRGGPRRSGGLLHGGWSLLPPSLVWVRLGKSNKTSYLDNLWGGGRGYLLGETPKEVAPPSKVGLVSSGREPHRLLSGTFQT